MSEKKLFGTSGIRGPVDTLFTPQFCFDIGRTFSIFLGNHDQNNAVAIGMDPRGSSPDIKKGLISGLIYERRTVYDQGASPIPAMNFILKTSDEYSGSIMVSGSHIKPHLNGLKFFAFKEEILKDHEEEISNIYESIREKVKRIDFGETEIESENKSNDEYQEYLYRSAFLPYPKWKVVVDSGDGAQSDTMPQILKRLGLEVIEINSTIQGEFYSRDTEVEGDMKQLQEKVLETKADFGVGYDSDGDRCVFIDEKGNFIPGDFTGTLIAKEIPTDAVVTPINTSRIIETIGKRVIRTKVGSPFVVSAMKENNAKFGFEANGGGIFFEMLSRDGGRSTIEILNILSRSQKRMSDLVSELPKSFIKRDKIEYDWDLKDKILAEAKSKFNGIKIDETDGLKIWLDETSWILFRSSANAPEFRVFVETDSEIESQKLLDNGLKLVRDVISNKIPRTKTHGIFRQV